MSLTLHFHPLASFCHKALIALYENDIQFEPVIVDLGEPTSRAAFLKLWPIGKMPVLHDHARDRVVPESSIIIEYLDQHHPSPVKLVPVDLDEARRTRLSDRFFDLYVQEPMQKIVTDRIRPAGMNDPHGVAAARTQLETALGMVDNDMQSKPWAMGENFTMADCAAAPALFYADKVAPLASGHPNAAAYLDRLMARPSVARVYKEAEPYFKMFPS
ncbi:glutathione S-transferase family protein [Aminobacter sp. AP02]|uniref:glutathione S-transferase family protein n=1 Tax=Aminobacter sp. AP02 TaxID=2135737 RepID=UPI000D6A9C73|nr:glutathione S-transferase family protein [Aminobacter sp. AP02]PWK68487.1 glutathione S-transferase [Aminobacter sp. AP02]